MNSAGGTCLGLHLGYLNDLAENIFSAIGRPLIHVLCHVGGRSDGIDGSHLTEHVGNMRCGIITITCHEILLICHNIFT